MPRFKPRKYRPMPLPLQIYNFKRLFLRANADLDDPYAEMDNIDWKAHLDKSLHFDENLHNLEEAYPQYRWRVPKKKKAPEKARHAWKKIAVGTNLLFIPPRLRLNLTKSRLNTEHICMEESKSV